LTISRPLRISLGPSRLLAELIVALHAAAALSVMLVFEFAYAMPLALLLVALGIASARRRALLKSKHSVRAIEIWDGGQAVLECVDGTRLPVQIAARRHVTRIWVAIRARGAGRISLVIAHDMLSRSAFRALRLWALWGRSPDPTADSLSR